MEHRMTTAEVEALALKLGHPTHDPHGDPIPTVDGAHLSHSGQSLSTAPLDKPLRIVHIEDEPEVIYAQLLAEGLFPGMTIKVLQSTPQFIRCWTERDECNLAPVVAANVSVEVLPKTEQVDLSRSRRLSQLALGETARIVQLSPAIHGLERRRLMDLGFLKGTVIQAEIASPSHDPVGYKVRGTLIALRQEQTHQIYVEDEATPNKRFSNTTTSEQNRGDPVIAS
jgi:DtxR family Mn-dependent transcriptional regulator